MENKQIIKALLNAQKEMSNAVKGSKNPFFKSKYADLNAIREACMPLLNDNGIVVLQPTVQLEGKNFVKTVLMHESGETIESLTEILFSKVNDAQAQGSGITYARRYGLQSLVNIGAEDDDGNGASKTPQPTPQPTRQPAKQPTQPTKLVNVAQPTKPVVQTPKKEEKKKDIPQGEAEKLLTACKTKKELGKVWLSLTPEMQKAVAKLKDQLKSLLK